MMAYYPPKMVGERLYRFGYGRPNRDKYLKWREIARRLGYFVSCKPDHASNNWLCWSDRSRKLWEAKERKEKGGGGMMAALWFVVELLACALALFSAWIVARFVVVAVFCAVACVSAFMSWTLGERRGGR